MPGVFEKGAPIVLMISIGIGLAACGGDSQDDKANRDASDIPPSAIALVGDRKITGDELKVRMAAVRRAQSGDSKLTEALVRQQAMSILVQQAALEEEARKRGITVTPKEVRERLELAKKQFPSERAYRRFLRRQTEDDVLFQLRIQTLSERIADDAHADGEDPQKESEQAQAYWREMTVCREGFIVPGCSNAPGATYFGSERTQMGAPEPLS